MLCFFLIFNNPCLVLSGKHFARLLMIANDSRCHGSGEAQYPSGLLFSTHLHPKDMAVFPQVKVWSLYASERETEDGGGHQCSQRWIASVRSPQGVAYLLTQLCTHMVAKNMPLHGAIIIRFLSSFHPLSPSPSIDCIYEAVMSSFGLWSIVLTHWVWHLRCGILSQQWPYLVERMGTWRKWRAHLTKNKCDINCDASFGLWMLNIFIDAHCCGSILIDRSPR